MNTDGYRLEEVAKRPQAVVVQTNFVHLCLSVPNARGNRRYGRTTLELDDKIVLETLRQIIDPELGCSIVDLGLIYDVQIEDAKVSVKMTLTSASCPMQASIAEGVHAALLDLEGVEDATVEIVFNPPWNPAMMSEYGRTTLGIYDS